MIDLLLPSRNRPEKLMQMMQSVKDTVTDINGVHIIIFIDEGDKGYSGGILPNTTVIQGESDILSKLWNKCYKVGTGDILMQASDDVIFETKGWDDIVRDHFKRHPVSLLYGRDGHQDENCPTFSFTSRIAAKHLGYFVPPYFTADWNDVWLEKLYQGIGQYYYEPKLMFRHLHVNVDPKYNDETYELAAERRQDASKVWNEKKGQIPKDIEKLKKLEY